MSEYEKLLKELEALEAENHRLLVEYNTAKAQNLLLRKIKEEIEKCLKI